MDFSTTDRDIEVDIGGGQIMRARVRMLLATERTRVNRFMAEHAGEEGVSTAAYVKFAAEALVSAVFTVDGQPLPPPEEVDARERWVAALPDPFILEAANTATGRRPVGNSPSTPAA